MKRVLCAFILFATLNAAFANGPAAKAASVKVAGVEWLNSFDAAKTKAAVEGKLILHLQMFGDLDDAYC